jgi:hypothetical protein
MYNNTDIKNRGNIINSLLKFTNDDSISFNVNIDSLYLNIHASNNYIIYNIDNKHVKDYKENAIDSFDIKNLNKINKDDIFKIILNNYEEEFPLYDFTNNYNKYSDKHNISFTIKDNYYIYTTTNGSNYKFDFDKEDKETQTSIKVEVPGILFESDCINIIKNDLNYFNKKYDNNIKLTDEQIDEIKKAFSNDITIDLKDTIIIKIYNIRGEYFIINYDITKKAID